MKTLPTHSRSQRDRLTHRTVFFRNFSACLLILASTFGWALPASHVAAAEKPNIVLIFIDDMGYGAIGPFGNTVNKTPSLDRMAVEGNVLRQFYVANTACTPSRAALMTGTYAQRIGMDGSVVFPGEKRGLNPDEITIAEVLKEAGYATGCFGKWHLGDQKAFLPLAQGFDEYFGIPYSNDMWPGNKRGNPVTDRGPYEPLPVIRGNEAVAHIADGADQALLAEALTDEAIKFIEAHREEPFFLYLPHSHIHNPRFARPDILEKAEGNPTRAHIEEVDTSVGRILDALREQKLDRKTLVIFTSDNGGAGTSMGPLRGAKGGPKYEGHMREPTITWWPGTIPAGVETGEIAVTTDILPSLAKLTGAKVPQDRIIDGKDVLDILLGKPEAKSPHDIHYYEVDGIRRGNWKIVRTGRAAKRKSELYDLEADIGEKNDISAQHPDVVAELDALLDAHAARIAADTRPAGFVDGAKPILTEPGDLPRLREWMGLPDTKAGGAVLPKASPKPDSKTGAHAVTGAATSATKPRQPNFVVILADDQGWNALSTRMDPRQPGSGSTYYLTPNLGRVAAQGMRFSQAYSPAPTCSPTRHAIQFGRSPASLKIFGADRITDWDATNDESLAKVLKRTHPAYVCAHLGKWHIGRSPEDLGFDVSDGMTGNGVGNSTDPNDPKLIFDLSNRSNKFIEQQVAAGKPFFIQISHYANHLKFQAKPETIRKYKKERSEHATPFQNSPLWAAMNENLDTGVGMVLDRIEELGIADNTYIIYTADNGYELKKDSGKPVAERQFYQAFPQRSHKYTVSEGGIRVPFIVRGPGIPAGSHSSSPIVGTDIFATVMDLAGGTKHLPQRVEGASLAAHLKSGGNEAINRKDKFLVFKYSKPNGRHDVAIVQDDYKLIKDIDAGETYLFNLAEDVGERDDLADQQPERVERLRSVMTSYLARFGWDESQAKAEERPGKPRKNKTPKNPATTAATIAPASAQSKKASGDRPNVLFIAIDDMNDWTTLFDDDHPIQTPNLKRLASRGTFFNRAYCASPGCNPSRTAIMTGLRPTTSGVYHNGQAWREKVPDAVSLPEHFAKHGGYVTRGAGKIYHHGRTGAEPEGRPSFQQFFKKLAIRGLGKNKNYNGYRIEDKTPLANLAFDWGVHDQKMIDVDMCEWVEARMEEKHDAPLFLAAGIFNPHLPFYADAVTFERYPKDKVKLPPNPAGDLDDVGKVGVRMSDKESFVYDQTSAADPDSPKSLHRMVQCYQAAADYADQMVGRLLDKIDATGRADNTIIVLWSDHGYHLGDKQCGVKFTLWEKANHVPFIIVAPGLTKPGSVCETPVSLVDIYPTLVELAGLPSKPDNDGLSLVPLLKDPDTEWSRPALMTEGPGNHAVRTRKFRYIRYHDGFEELYTDDDPWNHTNLASDGKYSKVLAEHRSHLPKTEAPGIPARYQSIDEEAWKRQRGKKSPQKDSAAKTVARDAHAGRNETLIANFEHGSGDWEKTGTAFDEGARRNRIAGFLGKGYINSYLNGDKTVGTLTSPPFTIERNHIKFLIGGGNHPREVGMALLIDGDVVRSATGNSRKNNKKEEILEWKSWEVSEFAGKEARIQVFDRRKGGWGHTVIDHIVQSDRGVISAAASDSTGFVPPPKAGVKLKDEWSTFPLYDQVGYNQALRPQFHFTSRMGWLNDPNGMVYYDGEWHMLFQHYTKGNASGAKSWGNAISTDLMHWEQLPHAINPYPKVDGSEGIHAIWSGSAVVDVHNALGKQKGDTKTLFALYSATYEKFFQGGAYSTDKGRTWTKINNGKPVIPHQEGFSKGQRDPRIFYYEPGDFYVTIMMIGGSDRLVRLWKSTNLIDWEIIGDIPNKAAECIDMYQVAVDGDPNNKKWVIADAGSHYEVGDFDGKNWKGFGDEDAKGKRLKFDFGDAWYAAQAFNQGPDGRVVHVGWLRSKQAGYRPFLEANMPFTQQMSIPVEITLQTTPDGVRMFRNPVKEIKTLYSSTTTITDVSLRDANIKLAELSPELIDLTLTFEPKQDLALNVRGLKIDYNHAEKEFQFTNKARVEGEKAGILKLPKARQRPYRDTGLRHIPAPPVDGKVNLRALVDRASLELFINNGRAAASFVVVPDPDERRIKLEGDDGIHIESVVVNGLSSIWKP